MFRNLAILIKFDVFLFSESVKEKICFFETSDHWLMFLAAVILTSKSLRGEKENKGKSVD